MEDKDQKLIEERLAKTIPKAFERLIHELDNEPRLILEGADQAEANEHTISEITSWLFRRRQGDGYRDN